MTDYIFAPAQVFSLPILGSDSFFPVSRIFCVGRNYADHAKEMDVEVDKDEPFFFSKPSCALVQSGMSLDYSVGTNNLHYEMELVVALGASVFEANIENVKKCIYGYSCGLDLTRRDLQAKFKKKSHPWDLAKAFENSAVISSINSNVPFDSLDEKVIELRQNDLVRQHAKLGDMVWRVEELIIYLSRYYHLQAGDVLFTGTPAGVGPIEKGDVLKGSIDGIGEITLHFND